jgi:hypothetical protein
MDTICFGIFIMVCQPRHHQEAPAPISTYCQIAKPMYFSKDDTRKSKEQMDTHNRVWKKLCAPAVVAK